jgi:hypothetical protein
MTKIRLTSVFIILFSTLNLLAIEKPLVLSSYWIPKLEKSVMDKIADQFEIAHPNNGGFEVIVPAEQKEKFLKLAPNAKLTDPDITASIEKQLNNFRLFQVGPRYRNFTEVETQLKDLESKYPDQVQLITYGKSREGRPLMALKISQNAKVDTNQPEVMLTAATHGDELITTEVLLGLIDQLLLGATNKQARFVNILANYEIFFIPVVNPDGFAKRNRYDGFADPNRSYPWPESGNKPTPSIAGIIDFYSSRKIEASIDFHAFGRMVMYPWGYTTDQLSTSETERFAPITTEMAKTNGYVHGPIATTIYVAKGSSCDYYYCQNKTLALAVEIGDSKGPPPSQIPSLIQSQAEATWLFVESVK